MIRSIAVALLAIASTACNPYSRYGAAVARDVDDPSRATAQMMTRLNLTVVHGTVPPDSVPVWAHELDATAKMAAQGVSDFMKIRPPNQSLQSDHSRLVLTIARQSSALSAAAAEVHACLSAPNDSCDRLASTDYYQVISPVADAQVNVGWRRADIAQDLKSHGITLSRMVP